MKHIIWAAVVWTLAIVMLLCYACTPAYAIG